MANFLTFKNAVSSQLTRMLSDSNNKLFVTNIPKETLWNIYLDCFPDGTNEIYKERREYDCNGCKSFIRKAGDVVTIKGGELISIWDVEVEYPFDVVAKALSKVVKSVGIKNIFLSKESHVGVDKNPQQLEDGTVTTWNHFHHKLPSVLVNSNGSTESIKGAARDSKNVFKRSMDELTLDSGQTVLELIQQGSLYRGDEFKDVITEFINSKTAYDKIQEDEKDNWAWVRSSTSPIARIRNTAIGTLLIDLSEGVDLDVAVTKFEKVMAPTNYKRPKAIFTKRMVEEAQAKIEELGYIDSLGRRFSTLDDITINNVLFINRDVKKVKPSVFDDLKEDVSINPKKFSKVEEITIDHFIQNILSTTKSIELMMESRHQVSLMSLIAPQNKNASSMLKWDNNFSWSYNGDITDSIKQNVKKAGGKIDGVLRFSIQWNDNADNENDLDAHCIEPNGNEIYYTNKGTIHPSSGMLDVDIINPNGKVAVENITWTNRNKMKGGRYKFFVHNYSHRGGRSGFIAEIEYDGQIYSYSYDKPLRQDENVVVAEIEFEKAKGIEFIKSLDSSVASKEIWGIKTNKFIKVSSLMLSPNYWDGQKGIGNKHYFFFLKGCKNASLPRGFYNEFLKEGLIQHKRVFEALGAKMRVAESEHQLSGLGFSSTNRNSVFAKVEGSFNRVIKITF